MPRQTENVCNGVRANPYKIRRKAILSDFGTRPRLCKSDMSSEREGKENRKPAGKKCAAGIGLGITRDVTEMWDKTLQTGKNL
jgi:hypothetical protein